MKSILFFILASTFVISETIPPPLWPERFSQNFVQGDSQAKMYDSGKIWYDSKNNRQRFDTTSSSNNIFCFFVGKNSSTPCSEVIKNDKLYILLPELNKCCMYGTAQEGYGIIPRNWLEEYKFDGQASLSGQSFYKWRQNDKPVCPYYYATEDIKNIPRRIEFQNFGMDFIVNSYSEQVIKQSVFTLPGHCEKKCPGPFNSRKVLSKIIQRGYGRHLL